MLILPVEKEIETEHKLIKKFTFRQAVCGGIIAATVFVPYIATKDLTTALVAGSPIIAACGLIGWYRKNNLYAEDYAMKWIQTKIYKNNSRRYRSANKYIPIYNAIYAKAKKAAESEKKGKRGKK